MKGPARVIFSAPRRHAWSRRCAMCFSRDAPPTDAARPARARLASVVSAIKAILGLISRCLDLSSRLSLRLTSGDVEIARLVLAMEGVECRPRFPPAVDGRGERQRSPAGPLRLGP
jgi:hypothetical protein